MPFCEWSCFWMAPPPVFYTFFEVKIKTVQFNLLGARVAKWQSNDKPNKLSHLKKLKWNPNSQVMLNWIFETLHYYFRKQHRNIENSQFTNKMLLSLSAIFSVYCDLCFLRLSQRQSSFFSSWTQFTTEFLKILNVASGHSCRKYFRFLVWKWLDITTCIKTAFTITSVFVVSRLQL